MTDIRPDPDEPDTPDPMDGLVIIAFEFNFDWGNIKKMLNHKTGDITSRYVHANVNSLRPLFDEIAQGLMRNYDGSYLGEDGEPPPDDSEDDF